MIVVDQFLGCRCAGSDTDDAVQVVGELAGMVDAEHLRAAGLDRQLLECTRVGRVRRADHDDGVALRGHRHQRRLPVGGGEAQVAAAGRPHVGILGADCLGDTRPVAVRQRGLRQQRDRFVELPAAHRPRRRSRLG